MNTTVFPSNVSLFLSTINTAAINLIQCQYQFQAMLTFPPKGGWNSERVKRTCLPRSPNYFETFAEYLLHTPQAKSPPTYEYFPTAEHILFLISDRSRSTFRRWSRHCICRYEVLRKSRIIQMIKIMYICICYRWYRGYRCTAHTAHTYHKHQANTCARVVSYRFHPVNRI